MRNQYAQSVVQVIVGLQPKDQNKDQLLLQRFSSKPNLPFQIKIAVP